MLRKIGSERPFKILSFTDTHLDDYEDRLKVTLMILKETVLSEKPDLVMFVGDNVTGGFNRSRARLFRKTMTGLGYPWAFVLGNHEGDNPKSMSRYDMTEEFKKSPLCLLPKKRPCLKNGTSVYGDTNFYLDLQKENGEVCFRIYFMDCNTDMPKEEMEANGLEFKGKTVDNCLKNSQIQWYLEQVSGDTYPSMMLCHIPLPEYKTAIEAGNTIVGVNYEGVSSSPINSGMFDAIKKSGKTKYFIAGHDHVNVSRNMYEGIQLIYNRMSGFSSYNAISKKVSDKLMQGCSLYYVNEKGEVSFDEIIYEDRYPRYHDLIYSVIRKE